ncbi:MAG: EMC3/TMCO1 family protein [Candidatus Aenigmatarchaeota archaeon]
MSAMIDILIYTLVLSLVIAILYRLLINPADGRRLKEETKYFRERISKARKSGNMEEVNKLTMESMKASQKQLALTMKPLLASLILFWIFFAWMGSQFETLIIASPFHVPLLNWEFPFFFLSPEMTWYWWYIVTIVPGSMFFRKMVGAYPY